MKGIDELFIVAWMLFGILLTPLFFIAFDLWAGIRKAKQRSEKISSDGWKRTVNKVARYYMAYGVMKKLCSILLSRLRFGKPLGLIFFIFLSLLLCCMLLFV